MRTGFAVITPDYRPIQIVSSTVIVRVSVKRHLIPIDIYIADFRQE